MDFTEYRQRGKEMVDYIADYLENIRDRRVFPDVKPGYMKNLLPDSAPIEGENWDTIFGDVERVIMPGVTHWQSPHMHAYFPALNSFPSLLGDMLADAINCVGFTWASSPACTELEIIVMNWLGKMINLPDDFLHLNSSSRGGGVVQTTASEATLVCLLAGRTRAIQRFHEKRPGYQDAEINARLVAYCSDQAHSSVEKAALIGLVRMRYIEADENLSMRGQLLREAIEDDIRQGLVPFWVCATLGTTGSCSFDNLEEIGSVCREFNLWLHVDAAYAGSAFICPEFRTWLAGIEKADSIAFNPSKWLMIHFDATALWVKDSTAVHRTFNVEPLYLQHENSGVAVDFMHWQIPLSRRFRALKIWFVLRSFGIKGLQRHIREGVRLAQKFEALVLADHRFEIPAKRHLGLVVFRIKGENEITERLLKRLNHRGNLHCIPASLKGKYVIRFTVTSTRTTVDDILRDWMEIKNSATAILDEMNITISNRVYLKDTKEKCKGFGSSLLLSNSPLSPKIVNGSFAALFDADEFLAKTYAGIRIAHQESPSMRRRVRGILMSGKQFSLDSHMDVVVQTSMDSNTTNSSMIDCYGKTSGNSKNKERDAICEDEESLEDCEMSCNPNTLLQLNSKNYLAMFNTQRLIPIDIIHHQNNLSILTKYSNKYEVNNYTRSVNSVRTPLTQYQLYEIPKENNMEKRNETTNLYPGKRFLNLDLSLHNVTSFTDTIYNLPTPTEDIIPIIITEGSPTSCDKSINEIEDLNKLRPPLLTTVINNNLKTINEKAVKKPEIPKKPKILLTGFLNETTPTARPDFILRESKINTLKPIPEITSSNLSITTDTILNETTKANLNSTAQTGSISSKTFKTRNTDVILNKTTTTPLTTTANLKEVDLAAATNTENIQNQTTGAVKASDSTAKPNIILNETTTTNPAANIKEVDLAAATNTVSLSSKTTERSTKPNTYSDLTAKSNTIFNETTTTSPVANLEEVDLYSATNTVSISNVTTANYKNLSTCSFQASDSIAKPNVILNEIPTTNPVANFNEVDAAAAINALSIINETTENFQYDSTTDLDSTLKAAVLTNTTTKANEIFNVTTANLSNLTTNTNSIVCSTTTTTSISTTVLKTTTAKTNSLHLNVTTAKNSNPTTNVDLVFVQTTTTPSTTILNADSILTERTTSTSTNKNSEVVNNNLNANLFRILNKKLVQNSESKEDLMSSSSSLSDELLESIRQPSSDSECSSATTLSIETI